MKKSRQSFGNHFKLAIAAASRSPKAALSSLPSDPNQLCDSLKLLLQEKRAGSNSDLINQEIIAIVDKLLDYKCIYKKQHKQLLVKCNLLHKEV